MTWVASGALKLCFDARIYAEYSEVLRRDKFRFDPEKIQILLHQIRREGSPVAAMPLPVELPDRDDEMFLEVAAAERVPYLVTGNLKHFPEELWCGVPVVTPRQFVDRYPGILPTDQ